MKETKNGSTEKSTAEKATAQNGAKPKLTKVPTSKAVLEALAKKHGKVRYVGKNEKFAGKLVTVRSVRKVKDAHGYDALIMFEEGHTQYVSPTSLKV